MRPNFWSSVGNSAKRHHSPSPLFCIARGREELIKFMKKMTGFTDMLVNVAREEEKVVIELIKSRIFD
jgi:hypothetical protein